MYGLMMLISIVAKKINNGKYYRRLFKCTWIFAIIDHNSTQYYLSAFAIFFVLMASIISHLVENHKHGMPGIGLSVSMSYYLNRLDVIGCFIVIMRLMNVYYRIHFFDLVPIKKNYPLFILALVLFGILKISEYDKYNAKLKNQYIFTHCIWHIGIFYVIDKFLNKIIYAQFLFL